MRTPQSSGSANDPDATQPLVSRTIPAEHIGRQESLVWRLHGPQDLRSARRTDPAAGAHEVTVRMCRAGICGSDMHYFTHGHVGRFHPVSPFVLGHEIAGEIIVAGPLVDPALIGRRVAIDPSMPCGDCAWCSTGRSNLCPDMRFLGSASCVPHLDGGFAETVIVPARNCHPLPDHMGWPEAAMTEPLSVALHALRRAGGVDGMTVLVTGGGTIGQLTAMAARASGAALIVLSDPDPYARQIAALYAADAVLDPAEPGFSERLAAAAGSIDLAFEASGHQAALQQCLTNTRRGGTIVQIGTLPGQVTLPLNDVMSRELTLAGSFRYAGMFGQALSLIGTAAVDPAPLVSLVLPLSEVPQAMSRAIARENVIKVQIEA